MCNFGLEIGLISASMGCCSDPGKKIEIDDLVEEIFQCKIPKVIYRVKDIGRGRCKGCYRKG
jgi:hypothetical protein